MPSSTSAAAASAARVSRPPQSGIRSPRRIALPTDRRHEMQAATTTAAPRSTSSASTPSGRCRWMRSRRRTPGIPGTPMAMAPVAYALWQQLPALRSGGSDLAEPRPLRALRWATPRCCSTRCCTWRGVKAVDPDYETLGELAVTLEDIKRFRQLDSKCPGHPEYRWTSGVETTTGPLGQGVAELGRDGDRRRVAGRALQPARLRAVRLRRLRARAATADMMEGVSGEAASLAGHLQLANLCWIYDNNHITIEGNTSLAFSRRRRRRASSATAGTSRASATRTTSRLLGRAFETFKASDDRPTLIIVDSHIGWGAPDKQDTSAAHGEPLGRGGGARDEAGLRLARGRAVPRPGRSARALPRAASASAAPSCARTGRSSTSAYGREHPELADQLERMQRRELPDGWDRDMPEFPPDAKGMARREASGQGPERHRPECPLADRRRGRPRPLDQDAPHLRGRRRLRARPTARRAQPALRDPRARDGRRR